jgi:hypothetical protein
MGSGDVPCGRSYKSKNKVGKNGEKNPNDKEPPDAVYEL